MAQLRKREVNNHSCSMSRNTNISQLHSAQDGPYCSSRKCSAMTGVE